MANLRNASLRVACLAAGLFVGQVHATSTTSIQFDIDTATLGIAGTNWDLAFDLVGTVPQNNSATITSFVITCGAPPITPCGLTGDATVSPISGNVTGSLSDAPPRVTLNDFDPSESFFNEYTHNADLGTSIRFVLDITDNFVGGDPDQFSFFFIYPLKGDYPPPPESPQPGDTFPTADPTGALFVYTIGNSEPLATFCPPDDVEGGCVTAAVIPSVPEPGVLALTVTGLLGLGVGRRSRRRPSRDASTA